MSSSNGRGFSFTIIAVLAAFGIGGIVLDQMNARNHKEVPLVNDNEPGTNAEKASAITSSVEAVSTFSSADDGLEDIPNAESKVLKIAADSGAGAKQAKRVAVVLSFSEMTYRPSADGKGKVVLKGKAETGARLRFLLDGEKLGETGADKSGVWQLDVEHQLEPGPHWIVVEQLNKAGKVVAKAETPFDREEDTVKADALSSTKAEEKAGQGAEESSGIRESAKKIWDKFAGIFQVDPGKKDETAETKPKEKTTTKAATESAPEAAKSKKRETVAPAASSTSVAAENKQVEDRHAASQPDKDFAFSGVAYKKEKGTEVLTLSGYASPGTRVRLFLGDEEIGEIVSDNAGNWSFEKKGKVTSGMHLFRAARILPSGKADAEVSMQYDHVGKAVVTANDRGVDVKKASTAKPQEKTKPIAQAGVVGAPKVKESKKTSAVVNVPAKTSVEQNKRAKRSAVSRKRVVRRTKDREPVARRYYSAHKDKSRYYARKKSRSYLYWRGCGCDNRFRDRRYVKRRQDSRRNNLRRGCRIIRRSHNCRDWCGGTSKRR